MSIIDTHAHLFVEDFKKDINDVVSRAKNAGVSKVLLPNISEETMDDLKRCTMRFPEFFYPMMGLHPTSVTGEGLGQLDAIYSELSRGGYIAIGEIGIDLYWDNRLKEEQAQAFETQLRWSKEHDLPVSIHFRNAAREVVESIKRVGKNSLRGVFHSFGGNREELEMILSLDNFFIGINGVVTFKNSGLDKILIDCPRDRVIVETDAPYLAPAPYRGKRNEPAFLSYIVEAIAKAWHVETDHVKSITTRNANRLFGLTG